MINASHQSQDERPGSAHPAADDHIAPVPRVSVQAFCETEQTSAAVQAASQDRRLGKAHITIKMGGIARAIETYHSQPTPNVIVLETRTGGDILGGLDELAGVCDPGTRVVVIGGPDDTVAYRELVRRGVNDYVVGPVETLDIIRSICSLFSASEAVITGRIVAVVGAKGGVGASTVAHNLAWTMAHNLALDSVVIDLDMAFGTAGLDYNQDPLQGIANAVFQPDRPDTALMERLLAKCTERLSLLAAPATLERVYDFGAEAFDAIFDTLRMTQQCIVLDVPHQWSAWTRHALINADDILVVAEPDLANLRNAKNLLSVLQASRPNDRPPLYCLNQVGMPKRPEIDLKRFAKTVEAEPVATIPFDCKLFGTAANNGQMIAEIAALSRTPKLFLGIANRLTGRVDPRPARGSLLAPIAKLLGAK
ncbi:MULTISPECIES: CpaE family protein [unclassified Bradyrhizobium]|uniref:AAA family ATPase n=1 Tax=unclassified Bradyrhizobium TaxID=2631580 RepID=UPI0028E2CF59|nr:MULTISPECIES: AAA family ATPase [unclassified Bradyrhizobium]